MVVHYGCGLLASEVQHSTISSISSASHVFPYLPTNLRPQLHPIITPPTEKSIPLPAPERKLETPLRQKPPWGTSPLLHTTDAQRRSVISGKTQLRHCALVTCFHVSFSSFSICPSASGTEGGRRRKAGESFRLGHGGWLPSFFFVLMSACASPSRRLALLLVASGGCLRLTTASHASANRAGEVSKVR